MHTVHVKKETSVMWVSNGDHAMQRCFSSFRASLAETSQVTVLANDLDSAVGTCLQRAANDPLATLSLPDTTRTLSASELGRLARDGSLPDVSVVDGTTQERA